MECENPSDVLDVHNKVSIFTWTTSHSTASPPLSLVCPLLSFFFRGRLLSIESFNYQLIYFQTEQEYF